MNFWTNSFLFFIIFYEKGIYCKGVNRNLNENTWAEMLEGEWMVEFFAPWCPACQQLQPLWEDFGKWSDDLGIKIGSVDVTANPGLSGRFMITALPTIYHVKDGIFRQYRGSRDRDSFISFIEEKKWQSLDPVSSLKSPQSFQMSAVSYFFKLSMYLRSVHTMLIQDYGLPYWLSYIVFGIATIIIGALLGLGIVCILDCCYTKSPRSSQTAYETQHEQINEEEYQGEDVIIGDPANSQDTDLRQRLTASQ